MVNPQTASQPLFPVPPDKPSCNRRDLPSMYYQTPPTLPILRPGCSYSANQPPSKLEIKADRA
jgi:hypothetical protein